MTKQMNKSSGLDRWRSIPLFITSTFRDMHAERDYLIKHVLPELEERLRKRRLLLEVIDLRWGVETVSLQEEQQKELRILRVCLDEIERSRPLQIILLGDRYGSVLPSERMETAVAEKGLSLEDKEISVTALEVEFGVFAVEPPQRRCFIYCRDPLPYEKMAAEDVAFYSDATNSEKLSSLKKRLEQALPQRYRNYPASWDAENKSVTGLEEFGNQVLDDLWSELDAITTTLISTSPKTWKESQYRQYSDFASQQSRGFVGREKVLDDLMQFALSPVKDSNLWGICITSAIGGGKSAIISKLFELLTQEDVLLLAHSVGIGERGDSIDAILFRWIEQIAQSVDFRIELPDDVSASRIDEVFSYYLEQAALNRRVVLLLDGLDRFDDSDRGKSLTWLPWRWPSNVRLLSSARPGEVLSLLKQREGCQQYPLPLLTSAEASQIAQLICQRYHRQLNEAVLQTLLEHTTPDGKRAAGNPLWINLVVEKINLLDREDYSRTETSYTGTPEQRLQQLLIDTVSQLPPEIPEMHHWVLADAEKINGEIFRAFVLTMALSRSGWREVDLKALIPEITHQPWSDLTFAQLRRSLRGHLIRRGRQGRWDFSRQEMRQIVLDKYALTPEVWSSLHNAIADYLESLPKEDPVRSTDLFYHYLQSQDYKRAVQYLAQPLFQDQLQPAILTLAKFTLSNRTQENGSMTWIDSVLNETAADTESLVAVAEHLETSLLAQLKRAGDIKVQITLLESIREFWQSLCNQNPNEPRWYRKLAKTYFRIGSLYKDRGELESALNTFTECKKTIANPLIAGEEMRQLFAMLEIRVADIEIEAGFIKQACDTYFRKISNLASHELTLADDILRYTFWGYASLIIGYGAATTTWYEYAIRYFKRMRSLESDLLDAIDREIALIHGRQSQAERLYWQLNSAFKNIYEAINITENLLKQDPANRDLHYDLGFYYLWLSDILEDYGLSTGNFKAALESSQKGYQILKKLAEVDPHIQDWQKAVIEADRRIERLRSRQEEPQITLSEHKSYGGYGSGESDTKGDRSNDNEPKVIWSTDMEEEKLEKIKADEPERFSAWEKTVLSGPKHGDWFLEVNLKELPSVRIYKKEELQGKTINLSPEGHQDILEPIAEQGDADAQLRLGKILNASEATNEQLEAAAQWLQKAAEQGLSEAHFELASIYRESESKLANPKKAFRHMHLAAQKGLAEAQFTLGLFYQKGVGVESNSEQAAFWYRKAAQQQEMRAMHNLGLLYLKGQGVNQDLRQGAIWIRQAAENESSLSCSLLAELYKDGIGVPQDINEAYKWYKKASDHGNTKAKLQLGLICLEEEAGVHDDVEAALWLDKAAKENIPEAQYNLGYLCLLGKGVPKDIQRGVEYIKQAAKNDYVRAQYELGVFYSQGLYVDIDYEEALNWYELAAKHDFPFAQFNLGHLYIEGKGVDKNPSKGIEWIEKAADQDLVSAQYDLGVIYSDNVLVKADFEKAIAWYSKAADQGFILAQHNLGHLYLSSKQNEKDIHQGIELLTQAANQGYERSQYDLGCFYSEGKLVEKDEEQAYRWYLQAAEKDFPQAMHNLAHCYLYGKGVERSNQKAFEWFQKAAEKGFIPSQYILMMWGEQNESRVDQSIEWAANQGYPKAQYKLGIQYYQEDTPEGYQKAAIWLAKSAQQGFAEAEHSLGHLFLEGKGVEQDINKGIDLIAKAANQDLAIAQYNLGVFYREGELVQQNFQKAFDWFQKSAAQNYAAAQFNLGYLYLEGKGVERDISKGLGWIEKAANQGLVNAQYDLGALYHQSELVANDFARAIYWYRKAAEQQNYAAMHNLGLMYLEGQGVPPDPEKAWELFGKAAQQGFLPSLQLIAAKVKQEQSALLPLDEAKAHEGDPQAQYNLGLYFYKQGSFEDFQKAAYWYRKSAEQNFSSAQYNLGYLYLEGKGVEADVEKGLQLIEGAANQGLAPAQYELGTFYFEGEYVEQDYQQAYHWYQKAALQDWAPAMHNLGHMYLQGWGVARDRKRAIEWFEKAVKQGFSPSQMALLKIENNS